MKRLVKYKIDKEALCVLKKNEEKSKINEEVLCVLKKNKETNQVEIDYIPIEKLLAKTIDNFSLLLDDQNSTLEQAINFIKTAEELNQLTTRYRYCVSLRGSFQAFSANNQDTITEIADSLQLMLLNQEANPEKYDINKAIAEYKKELKNRYILWHKAFSINKTYHLCHEDKSILTFSHRIDGWSNPVYQLTTNFSIEIKTNFGYGRASYFYTKLKYKNIEITPFSEWIDYEFAKFSEIVRYTQSYPLRNEYWFEAMEFSRDACNLSLEDEVKFVEKYVIDECEKMVSGLEEIFYKEQFSFKDEDKEKKNCKTVDKKGHTLVEFRGEKISGALDFISKILEFEKITSIKSFIERIEGCNKRIQPILFEESAILKVKIDNLKKDKIELQPKYDEVVKINDEYNQKKVKLQEELFSKEQLDDFGNYRNQLEAEFKKEFIKRYPEYKEFKKEYDNVTNSYRILTEQIQNNTKIRENIIDYNEKIKKYFGKQ